MSSWKTEGGNKFNNIVNTKVDITNKYFSTDPTLAVNDREGIYYFRENSATVLGVGTKNPYSRLSFGDYRINNYQNNILKSESLVNTPSIAFSEKSDGTNATGVSFYYNRAGTGESRGLRFTVNNNQSGTIFNSSLEPQAISNENTLMLMTNDGNINSVFVNTTSSNFPNPKNGLEVNGEIRGTNGLILKAQDSANVDRQAGLIFYDIKDKNIKWCTGSGDDIKTVVASGESGFVIDTSKYDASFALVENTQTQTAVLAFKDMAFAIGNGEMITNRFIGTNPLNNTYIRENLPAFTIVGQTVGNNNYNANMMLSHIDYMDGSPILSGTSVSDISLNGVMYLLNNLAIDVYNPLSIIDVSKNHVPFLNIGSKNINCNNSVVIGCDISGSLQSFYFGENITNNIKENKFNLCFGKNLSINDENCEYNLIFGTNNNLNLKNNYYNLVLGNNLNIENDVSSCLIMGYGGTARVGDLIKYFENGYTNEVFGLKSGGIMYVNKKLYVGSVDSETILNVYYTNFTNKIGLNLNGDSGIAKPQLNMVNSANGLKIETNNTNNSYYAFSLNNDTNNIFIVKNSGFTGIGISEPESLLHLSKENGCTFLIENSNGDFSNQNQSIEFRTTYGTSGFIHQKGEDLRMGTTGSSGTIKFYTNENTSGYVEQNNSAETSPIIKTTYTQSDDKPKMVILNNGNIGIGLENPLAKLHITHSDSQNEDTISLRTEGIIRTYAFDGDDDIRGDLTNHTTGGKLLLYSGSNTTNVIKTKFSAESQENSFINNSGKFGIGTDTPLHKLDVSGNLIISGESNNLYFNNQNTSINSVNNNITFKTSNQVRLTIDEFGETFVDGILSIETLKIQGNIFDSAAASSWTSTSSIYPSINVNFNVGINNQNTSQTYRNFKPYFALDVGGNVRSNNMFFGLNNLKVIPEYFNTDVYQDTDLDSFYYGTYTIQELNTENSDPAWKLFDGDDDTKCILDENSIAEFTYIETGLDADNNLEDIENTIKGAYLDITLTKRWAIKNYSISYNSDISDNELLPKSWYLFGKTHLDDDNTIDQTKNKWKLIDYKNETTSWSLNNQTFEKVFDLGEYVYKNEKYLRFKLLINQTYSDSADADNTSNFEVHMTSFQLYGETNELNLSNCSIIQSTFSESNLNTKNMHLNLQPMGNNVGIRNKTPQVILDINDTGAIRLPIGTEQQGVDVANKVGDKKGYLRYNTTKNQFEGYYGTIWRGLGGLIDTDQDTFIETELNPDEDTLRFFTAGIEKMNIDALGNFDISSNIIDISFNHMNFNSKINIDISNNLNILNDLSANFVKSKKILLDDRMLRKGDVIKATHPEDDNEDLFVLNSLNAIFDVKFDSDDDANLHEYLIDDVPYPTLRLHAGTVIQFNLDLVDNSFNIFEGGEQNTTGITPMGLVHVDNSGVVLNGISANDKLNGTLYWHVPINTTKTYRYQSSKQNEYKGDIIILPVPQDISNNNILTKNIQTNDISANLADIVEISNNILYTKTVDTVDISVNQLIINDRVGILTNNPTVVFEINSETAMRIPSGPEGTRETGIVPGNSGYLRYNTTSNQFEGYDGANWSGLGGVISVDQETHIIAQDTTDGLENIGSLIFTVDNKETIRVMGGPPGGDRFIGINNTSPNVVLDIIDTGAIRLPAGTTTEGSNITTNNLGGYIRYNTQKSEFEGYDGTNWFSFGSNLSKNIDTDMDTYIATEEISDDDTLRFYTEGTQKMTLNNTGDIELTGNFTSEKNINSDKTFTNYLKVGNNLIRTADIIKETNPEDDDDDFIKLQSLHGYFDVTFDTDLNEYNFNDTPMPTIYAYPGSILQFNLNTGSEPLKIFKGSESNTSGIDVTGIVHIADDKTVQSGDVDNVSTGTLFWHVPYDAIGNYRYQSQATNTYKGDIIILPHISDISNNHIKTNHLIVQGDLSGNDAYLHDVSVNRLWIGNVEMLGYIPGNISNPNGICEIVGDLVVKGFTKTQNARFEIVDISRVNLHEQLDINLSSSSNVTNSSIFNLNYTNVNTPNLEGIHVSGDSGVNAQMTLHNSTNGIKIETNNNSASNYSLNIENNGNSLLHVANNGEVGIGTNSPACALDVVTSGNEAKILIQNDTLALLQLSQPTKGHQWNLEIGRTDGEFSLRKSASGEKLRIKSNGDVGIGTTSPQAKLHVMGDLYVEETNNSWRTDTGKGLYFRFYNANGGIGYIQSIDRSNNDTQYPLQYYAQSHDFKTRSGNVDYTRLKIDEGGNVAIGYDTPRNKLDVNGGITCGKIFTDASTLSNDSHSWIFECPRPGTTSGGAIHFINGENRSTDGGESTYTIRNDSGNLRLGNASKVTYILGTEIRLNGEDNDDTKILTYDSSNHSDITGLVPGTTGGTLIEVKRNCHLVVGLRGNDNQDSFNVISRISDSTNTAYTNPVATFKANGYVGFGDNSPTHEFCITKTQNAFTTLKFKNDQRNSGTSGSQILFTGYRDVEPNFKLAAIRCINYPHKDFPESNWLVTQADLVFYTNQSYSSSNMDERMRINAFGNVGIGTSTDLNSAKLTVKSTGDTIVKLINGSANKECAIEFVNNASSTTYGGDNYIDWKVYTGGNAGEGFAISKISSHAPPSTVYSLDPVFFIYSNVTSDKIGTANLNCGLHIQGYRTNPHGSGTGITYNSDKTLGLYIEASNSNLFDTFKDNNQNLVAQKAGLQSDYAVLGTAFIIPSDKRIKTDIEEVPDNFSLQKLRDISCCYYGYIDKLNRGFDKTIGFIAQQVKEHMPMAVSTHVDFIPNELRSIENPQWTKVENTNNSTNNTLNIPDLSDVSGNIVQEDIDISTNYILTIPDLRDVSDNTVFKFYVTDDLSGAEIPIETKKLPNNKFMFKHNWKYVFLYGEEIIDFHKLDKQKLFTLNFSATQEIDKIQCSEKQRLDEAYEKINELEEKNKTLENTLEQVLKRLTELENK